MALYFQAKGLSAEEAAKQVKLVLGKIKEFVGREEVLSEWDGDSKRLIEDKFLVKASNERAYDPNVGRYVCRFLWELCNELREVAFNFRKLSSNSLLILNGLQKLDLLAANEMLSR
ncbi:MAG: hypothetical protein JXR42_06020 [Gammaproteobacteria bacterium]|nr:hypothetical protein [Gammaproteobacteria bacterium]